MRGSRRLWLLLHPDPSPGKARAILAQVMVIVGLFAFTAPGVAQVTVPQQAQPRIIVQNGHASPISAATWTADGQFLLTGSTDGQVLVWDLAGRIVNRITLGSRNNRTVVEEIAATADGTGFAVTEIEFRDMYDNGVGSEIHRRRYRIGFGDQHSEASETTQVDPPWAEGISFYAGSIGHKNALFARSYETVSKQGWALVKADGQLAMRPPGPASSPVPLRGALGFASDQGDAQMEAHARKFDLAEQGILRFAAVLEELRECALQRARIARRPRQASNAPVAPNRRTGDVTLVHRAEEEEPCLRQPIVESDIDLSALGDGDTSVSQRPQISPDGKRLAWIDPATWGGPGWNLQILDLDRGTTRSARFDAPIASARMAWTDATSLLARTPAGDFAVDGESAAVRAVPAAACLPVAADEVARTEAPDLSGVRASESCATGPAASDARRAVRLSAVYGIVHVADAVSGRHVCTAFIDQSEIYPAALTLASNDKRWILLQSGLGYTELFTITEQALQSAAGCTGPDCAAVPSDSQLTDSQLRQRKCSAPAAFIAEPGRVGFHPTLPLLWSEGRGGRIDFYLTANIKSGLRGKGLGTPLFTLFRLPDARFFAIDGDGRYDTNLPPDTSAVRWTMSDAPLQSLAPQTFMRDYYQPGLMRRLLECSASPGEDCASRFPPVRALASLNRVLPQVRIVGVRQGKSPSQAIVSVEVADGRDDSAPNAKTMTGVYDVRVFRNNRLVRHHPDQVYADVERRIAEFDRIGKSPSPGETPFDFVQANPDFNQRRPEFVAEGMRKDIAFWRSLSQVKPDPAKGYPVLDFHVDLPTAAGTEESVFSAYAFNEDRVKSETAQFTYRRPAVTPRKPRAFVVSIGIDAYDSPRLQLLFAASDADLIATRLAEIPGYEVRRLTLAGKRSGDGKTARVTREAIEIMFSAMGGADVPVSAQYLEDQGIDASQLDHVKPDDIVIVAFSGHGWADPRGDFYLLPIDVKWPDGADAPDTATLLSSANLSVYLGSIPAAEIALVIDACHSAASVDGGDFRPGPMGDSGLGQLAFDKGIRILAATQADDVALEDPVLRQGLLTYALAGEGITATGGKADGDRDGKITLDEWLAYATKRMPSLSSDARLGRLTTDATGARGWVQVGAGASKPAVQEPSLFDFNAKPSGIVLRDSVRP